MSEERATPSPSPAPTPAAPSLTLAVTPAVCKKGHTFALSGSVMEFKAPDLPVALYRKTGESLHFLKRASLDAEGAFRASVRATTAGKWTCVAAYSSGSATYFARPVMVTVKR